MTAVKPDDRLSMRLVINSLKKKWSQVSNISTGTLAQWMTDEEDSADARPEEEFVVSHIRGAMRIEFDQSDVSQFVNRMEEQEKAGQLPTIVCYCSLGYRSSKFADTLQKATKDASSCGLETAATGEIYNLEGSIFKWANENRGHMVDGKDRPTKFVHPFSPIWGKVLFRHLRRDQMET